MAEAHAETLIGGHWLPSESAEHFAYRMATSQIAIAAYRNVVNIPHHIIAQVDEQESEDK